MSTDVKAHKKRKRDGAQDAVNGTHKKHKSKENIVIDKESSPASKTQKTLEESKEERKRRRKEEKLSQQASQQAAEEIANNVNDDNEKLPDDTQETLDLDEASQAKIERRRLKKLQKEQLKAEQRAKDDEENSSVQVETQVMSSASTLVPDSQSSQHVPATQLDPKVKGKHHKHKDSQSSVNNIPSTYTTPISTASATTSTDASPFTQRTTSLYVPLSPVTADFPLAGLCAEHLSPLLLHYYPPLKGIVLAYSNPSTSTLSPTTLSASGTAQPLALAVAEYAAPYIWLTATFTLLRPSRGARMAGHVILQNETHISLLCYNYFNASIERRALPREWEFQKGGGDGEGYFVDEHGEAVEGLVEFWALDFESAGVQRGKGGVVSIEGTMREEQVVKNKDV